MACIVPTYKQQGHRPSMTDRQNPADKRYYDSPETRNRMGKSARVVLKECKGNIDMFLKKIKNLNIEMSENHNDENASEYKKENI